MLFSSTVGSLCHTCGVVRRPSFVAHHPTSVVRRVSSVSTITTRNNKDIKSIFGANVHHVPGLCLLGIGGAPYISHKIIAQNQIFIFSTSSLKPPTDGASYYARRFPRPRSL